MAMRIYGVAFGTENIILEDWRWPFTVAESRWSAITLTEMGQTNDDGQGDLLPPPPLFAVISNIAKESSN